MRHFSLTNYARQVVLGTLLGTSCVRKHANGRNCSLYMRSAKDRNWFLVKCKHLEAYARNSDVQNAWESCVHPIWNPFRSLCYKNGKKAASMKWLDMLQEIGLSVWFLDKGGICGNRAYIRVANLGNHKLIKKWFDIIGYSCEIKKKMIVFEPKASERLLKSITPSFPKYLLDMPVPYRVRKYL